MKTIKEAHCLLSLCDTGSEILDLLECLALDQEQDQVEAFLSELPALATN